MSALLRTRQDPVYRAKCQACSWSHCGPRASELGAEHAVQRGHTVDVSKCRTVTLKPNPDKYHAR
jgi:hypothetical protein